MEAAPVRRRVWRASLGSERWTWLILALGMVGSVAAILAWNRSFTFYADELTWLQTAADFSLNGAFYPASSNLQFGNYLIWKGLIELFGAEYVAWRITLVALVQVTGLLFFLLVRRRIGSAAALAPTLILIYLGSAGDAIAIPLGILPLATISCGLGALLLLEPRDSQRRGGVGRDIAACVLLICAVGTFSVGLAFLAGAAVWVLLRDDRWRRIWIPAIPLVLYAIWWIWSRDKVGPYGPELSNVPYIPFYFADALLSVGGAFANATVHLFGFNADPASHISQHYSGIRLFVSLLMLAGLIAVIFAATRYVLRRGRPDPSLLVSVTILVAYWTSAALVVHCPARCPGHSRYLLPGAVLVLLVVTDALRGARPGRGALAALYGLAAVSIFANLGAFPESRPYFLDYSQRARAVMAAMELGRADIDSDFNPGVHAPEAAPPNFYVGTEGYLMIADGYGSLATPLSKLPEQTEIAREGADVVLAKGFGLKARRVRPPPSLAGCESRGPRLGKPLLIFLPRGGAILGITGSDSTVGLKRFADIAPFSLGKLSAGGFYEVRIPPDRDPIVWQALVNSGERTLLCPLDQSAKAPRKP